ncbi:MAG: DNA repair protein RecO [Clostridia bacterium]
MSLIKIKGIVIKETTYKDNDKIITILTDNCGKISCIAKGSKRTNSPILANSQYLVYSEFVLYRRSSYYYVNSASVISTFYNLRVDFDKLQAAFEMTKIINLVTDENQDTSEILKLFLNTLYILDTKNKEISFITSIFKIKMFDVLGFSPRVDTCSQCGQVIKFSTETNNTIFYDYVSNVFLCVSCIKSKDVRRYIKLSQSTFLAIKYVLKSDVKKLFAFELKNTKEFNIFGQAFVDAMSNGV